jgi:hypothetical protein
LGVPVVVAGVVATARVEVEARVEARVEATASAKGGTLPSIVNAVGRVIQASSSAGVCARASKPDASGGFGAAGAVGEGRARRLDSCRLRNGGAVLLR